MTQDVSGFGSVVNIIASNTFPQGFTVTQFSNDTDPFDSGAIRIADVAMGVNGDLIVWRKATPIPADLSVIAGSPDDINLQVLSDANRVAQNKASAGDEITLTIVYPDLTVIQLIGGVITESPFAKSISGEGKLKTKTYKFIFQDKIGV